MGLDGISQSLRKPPPNFAAMQKLNNNQEGKGIAPPTPPGAGNNFAMGGALPPNLGKRFQGIG